MLRRPLVVTFVVGALALGGCGSSSNGSATGGSGGAAAGSGGGGGGTAGSGGATGGGGGGGGATGGAGGGTGGAGGAGNPFRCGTPGMSSNSCTQAENDAYGKCVQDKCGTALGMCFGPNYQSGQIAGPCAGYLNCVNACACNDNQCRFACVQSSLAGECTTCLLGVSSCSMAMCPPPACAVPDGGAPLPDGGFNIPDGGFNLPDLSFTLPDLGNGMSCADLKKCCDALPATSPLKNGCTAAQASGMDAVCGATLTGLKGAGACQ